MPLVPRRAAFAGAIVLIAFGGLPELAPPADPVVAAASTPAAAAGPAPSPPATAFDPATASPYFATPSRFAAVITDLWLARPEEADRLCARALEPAALAALSGDLATRGRLLCGVAALRARHYALAATRLAAVAASGDDALLAPYLGYWRAQAAHQLGHDDRALEGLAAAIADPALAADAALLRIDCLRAEGENEAAVRELRAFLVAHPSSARSAEARLDLALTLLRMHADRGDALAALRAILVDASLDPAAALALPLYRKITGERAVDYDAAELVSRGRAEFDAMKNEASETTFRAALVAPGLTPEVECQARYYLAQSVFKQRQRGRSAALFDDAYTACARTTNRDLAMRSLYQAGRGHMAENDDPGAIARFLQAAKDYPDHSFADDALLRASEAYDDANDPRDAEATLAAIADRFPGGDMVGEAIFRLAFRHYKRGEWAAAETWLDRDLALFPHETRYWRAGQSRYWKARIADQTGRPAEALADYETVVRDHPLGWYALLAFNRLRQEAPAREQALVAALRPVGPAPDPRFAPRAAFASEGFHRAVELIRLGLGSEGARELDALGLEPTTAEAQHADPDTLDLLWLEALLFDRAGDYAHSHWIPKAMIPGWNDAWPTAATLWRWKIAFPRGYAALVEPWATREGVPVALEYAIIREESAFDPLCESFANAMGLTQQMLATARKLGRKLGIAVTRQTLFDPNDNVPLGAAEIGGLLADYGGDSALAVPAYNAGDGAVARWNRDHGGEPLDAWAEDIGYDETRYYEKRVHASYFAYQWLYGSGDPVPVVPLDPPVPGAASLPAPASAAIPLASPALLPAPAATTPTGPSVTPARTTAGPSGPTAIPTASSGTPVRPTANPAAGAATPVRPTADPAHSSLAR